MEKIFISSKQKGCSEINVKWSQIRAVLRKRICSFGHRVKMFELEGPQPDTSTATYVREAREATCFIGIFGTEYSEGTVNEYCLNQSKPWYVFLLKVSTRHIEKLFSHGAPVDTDKIEKIRVVQEDLKAHRTCRTIHTVKELWDAIDKTLFTITVQHKWTLPPAFDPHKFVGRNREIQTMQASIFSHRPKASCLLITGPSFAGKTSLLRKLGLLLELSEQQYLSVEYLPADLLPWSALKKMIHSLIPLRKPKKICQILSLGDEKASSLIVGASGFRFVERAALTLLDILEQHGHRKRKIVWLVDDLQDWGPIIVQSFLLKILLHTKMDLHVIICNRSDGSAPNRQSLEAAVASWPIERFSVIHLAQFEEATIVLNCICEHAGIDPLRSLTTLIPKSVESITTYLPGDLAEIGILLREHCEDKPNLSSLEVVIHKFLESGSPNASRWARLRDWQKDCRVICPLGTRIPEKLIALIYQRRGQKFRKDKMEDIRLLRRWSNGRETFCAVFPERFSEYVVKTYMSTSELNNAAEEATQLIFSESALRPNVYWLNVAIGLLPYFETESEQFRWSIKLGKLALKEGWLQIAEQALRILGSFAFSADRLSKAKIDLLLEYTDVLRQIGKRQEAKKLVAHLLGIAGLNENAKARSLSLLLRLERDMNGGDAAFRLWQKVSRSHHPIKISARLLDQLARIARDRGQLVKGFKLAFQAEKSVRQEMTGFRRWRALAEIQYTVGSIARGLNDYQLAVEKLRQSLELRKSQHDWQGMSYPLCELAYISIMQDRYQDAKKSLEQALAIARREEISDKRAEAFIAAMYTVYYLRKGEFDNARSYLELLRRYMWTKEQGLRGNPDLLEGYICLRENQPKEAERLFTRCLSSWDRTVRTSAMIGLSKVCSTTQQRQRYLNRAKTLARRWEFPLQTSVPVSLKPI